MRRPRHRRDACATGFVVGRASVPAKLEAGTEARPTIQIRGWEGVRRGQME